MGSLAEVERVTRSKEQARASYDRMSRWYDLLTLGGEKKSVEEGLKLLKALEGERILEVGFGTGRALLSLAQAVGDSGKVSGIDISRGMASAASRRLQKHGLESRVAIEVGDASVLPYEDDSFDAVFMSFTLELFDTPEIPAVLEECRRVLRRGGRICVVSISNQGKGGTMMKMYLWSHRKFPSYVDCRPIFAEQALESAGFEIITTKRKPVWGLPVDVILAEKVG